MANHLQHPAPVYAQSRGPRLLLLLLLMFELYGQELRQMQSAICAKCRRREQRILGGMV